MQNGKSITRSGRNIVRDFLDGINRTFGSNKPDIYREGDMDFKVKDHTYRNIYARGHVDTSGPKTIVYALPALAAGLFQFLVLALFPAMVMMMSSQARGHYLMTLAALYLVPKAWVRSLILIAITVAIYMGMRVFALRYWQSQNADSDQSILNNDEYQDDSEIRQPEELSEDFDIFPDAGAHSKGTDVTAILSHIMLTNKGLKPITMPLRASKDENIDGDLVHKNELLYNEHDEIVKLKKKMIDEDFGDLLWDSDLIPRPVGRNARYIQTILRRRYDPDKLLYNPHEAYGKAKEHTVADRINDDWYMPEYEVQRPAGMYIVDTEPNNTMVSAMTRAGKGETASLIK